MDGLGTTSKQPVLSAFSRSANDPLARPVASCTMPVSRYTRLPLELNARLKTPAVTDAKSAKKLIKFSIDYVEKLAKQFPGMTMQHLRFHNETVWRAINALGPDLPKQAVSSIQPVSKIEPNKPDLSVEEKTLSENGQPAPIAAMRPLHDASSEPLVTLQNDLPLASRNILTKSTGGQPQATEPAIVGAVSKTEPNAAKGQAMPLHKDTGIALAKGAQIDFPNDPDKKIEFIKDYVGSLIENYPGFTWAHLYRHSRNIYSILYSRQKQIIDHQINKNVSILKYSEYIQKHLSVSYELIDKLCYKAKSFIEFKSITQAVKDSGLLDKNLEEIKKTNMTVYNRVRLAFYKYIPGRKLGLGAKIDEPFLDRLEAAIAEKKQIKKDNQKNFISKGINKTKPASISKLQPLVSSTAGNSHLNRAISILQAAKTPDQAIPMHRLKETDPLAAAALMGWAKNLRMPAHQSITTESMLDNRTLTAMILRSTALRRLSQVETYAERFDPRETQLQYVKRVLGQSKVPADDEKPSPDIKIEWPLKLYVERGALTLEDIDEKNAGDSGWIRLSRPKQTVAASPQIPPQLSALIARNGQTPGARAYGT